MECTAVASCLYLDSYLLSLWFLAILPIGNLSFYVNPKGFFVSFSFNISLLGLTLNWPIGSVHFGKFLKLRIL